MQIIYNKTQEDVVKTSAPKKLTFALYVYTTTQEIPRFSCYSVLFRDVYYHSIAGKAGYTSEGKEGISLVNANGSETSL